MGTILVTQHVGEIQPELINTLDLDTILCIQPENHHLICCSHLIVCRGLDQYTVLLNDRLSGFDIRTGMAILIHSKFISICFLTRNTRKMQEIYVFCSELC